MRKIILGVFLFFGLLFFSGCGNPPEAVTDNSAIILFYSKQCPHCIVVEKYIADNNIKDRVTFSQHEVGSDKASANLMIQKQKECQVAKDSIGAVPFMWTAEKCYLGQEEIINFFKDKINAQ